MIPLTHFRASHPDLDRYKAENPGYGPADFVSKPFHPVKLVVKAQLHEDQGGLCVYCERAIACNAGEVEHIKPKRGRFAYPHLALEYMNFAFACTTPHICGNQKDDGVLPIEPGPGCNDAFVLLASDGSIEPVRNLTGKQRQEIIQTRDMLGLQRPFLKQERAEWASRYAQAMQVAPEIADEFLQGVPFRYILRRMSA